MFVELAQRGFEKKKGIRSEKERKVVVVGNKGKGNEGKLLLLEQTLQYYRFIACLQK